MLTAASGLLFAGLGGGGLFSHAAALPEDKHQELSQLFKSPPQAAKPSGYWWWLYCNVDKASITRDLKAFSDKGIGSVLLVCSGNWGAGPIPSGPEFLSPEWKELFLHALKEAERHNITVDVNMAPGWNMGGPWITPDKACRWYLQSETTLEGPKTFEGKLPLPGMRDGYNEEIHFAIKKQLNVSVEASDYRDTAVVAFRVPQGAGVSLKNNRADLAAKSARTDGNCWVPAEKVMGDPRKPWTNAPQDVAISPQEVVDLTSKLTADGVLAWEVPEGQWVVVRTGHRKTGAMLNVPIPGKEGLENDFLDRAGVEQIFEHTGKRMAEWAGPLAGKTLRAFCSDSFEAGYPNWTANMPKHFKNYRGYDMTPYLPVLRGYIVGSAELSERFLHDYRKTLADCMADEHYGRFAELAAQYGMEIRAEPAGPNWSATLCMDGLKNLGRVHYPQGEFWRNGFTTDNQNMVGKQTASGAHIYGRKTASAEAFTSSGSVGPGKSVHWSAFPANLKPLADRAFCEGINDLVFHTLTAQKPQDGKPGYAYGAGTHFNPNVTWWEQTAKSWLDYINRCQALLQSGLFVADVLYYNGDWAPNAVPPKRVAPSLGKGYDSDYCNEEVLLTRLSVKEGRLVLPDGMSYRLLALPDDTRMPAAVARKVAELVKAGATVVGPPPLSDPGLLNYPQCDTEVQTVARELWGEGEGNLVVERTVGKGRVFFGRTLREILLQDGVPPDFEVEGQEGAFIDFIHRQTADSDLYFVCNRTDRPEEVTLTFRQRGRQPERWDPVTGEQRRLPDFSHQGDCTKVPLRFEPQGSCFVVFRRETSGVRREGPGGNDPKMKPVMEVTGAWTVNFDRAWFYPVEGLSGKAAEGEFIFTKLDDWSQRPEPAIKHFSGTANYRLQFSLAEAPKPGATYLLDLGSASVSAQVKLNGQDMGVAWCSPWRVAITPALKQGENMLEIKVVNCWPNRLIGDGLLPKEQRRTHTNLRAYEATKPNGEKKELKLLPSGLHGPVRIMTQE